jgi:formylglycine-generating enzyme required for sulfatase activity
VSLPSIPVSLCSRTYSRGRFSTFAAILAAAITTPGYAAVTIDWVTVGDPGNVADTTGLPNPVGGVAGSFQIMKFEWTNSQYVQFLNSADPLGTNPNSVYSLGMGTDARGGITYTSGNADGTKYAVKTGMGDKPVNYVTWWDAARVSNWLHNGQGSGSTEIGAYTLNNATSGTLPVANSGARYSIPTQDEWYKAAYYKGGGTNAGYWDYATQSDTAPTQVIADQAGNGSAGSVGNFANFEDGANWNGQQGNLTTVGTNGGPSAYGAFDMSGNIAELNDLTRAAGVEAYGLRGGSWHGWYLSMASLSYGMMGSAVEGNDSVGFRLASPVAIPEPSTYAMALAGLACGGYSMYCRRKRA